MGSLIAMAIGTIIAIAFQLHVHYHGRRYVIGYCDLHDGLCGRVEFTTHLSPRRFKRHFFNEFRKAQLAGPPHVFVSSHKLSDTP